MQSRLTVLVISAIAALAAAVPSASAQGTCPVHEYLGNYPNDREFEWSPNGQGVAHSSQHWFFTQRSRILKFPVGFDLNVALENQQPGWRSFDRLPRALARKGFDHFGDPHVYGGYLFVPVESRDRSAIAAFQTTDLAFIDAVETTHLQGRAAWLAVNARDGLLYTSDGKVSATEPLLRYRLDLAALRDPRVPRTRKLDVALDANRTDAALTLHSTFPLSLADGRAPELVTMQGGVFTPAGDLYLASMPGDEDEDDSDRGGITLWDEQGRLITRSHNVSGLGGFKYEFHYDRFTEEPEGLDWWNRSVSPRTPKISGQLHAMMIDNDWTSDDDLYFKHYRVSYRCRR